MLSRIFLFLIFFLSVGCISSKTLPTQDIENRIPASVENGQYLGVMTVNGKLLLEAESGRFIELESGAVQIQLKNANPLLHPINRFKGERLLKLKQQNGQFIFKVPQDSVPKEGKIFVHEPASGQNAHFTLEEKKEFIESYEEEGTTSCNRTGMCHTCGMDFHGKQSCGIKHSTMCPGSKRVLRKIDLYKSNLILQIHSNEGSADINTSETREIESTILKALSGCR